MTTGIELPGLDCGLCGYRKCDDLAARLAREPELIERCIHIGGVKSFGVATTERAAQPIASSTSAVAVKKRTLPVRPGDEPTFRDSLDRDVDFYLEHFPEEPGPRETIRPHNPMLTRELDMRAGDLMIGRPLGMSCGCPITHCGVVMSVEPRTGVMVWCVTGPLRVRQESFKDIGYYSAEAYEGLVQQTKVDIRIGCRYFFQPRMCMLQWRHSGLVNFVNKTPTGMQIRLEGLWIG